MPRFLILRLDGPMQAWGTHTYEDFRPSNLYPTRSGLLGLLAACLGIERIDLDGQSNLAASVEFSVRIDSQVQRFGRDLDCQLAIGEQLLEARKLETDNVLDLFRSQWVEDDDVVHPVQEFRLEV